MEISSIWSVITLTLVDVDDDACDGGGEMGAQGLENDDEEQGNRSRS